MTKRDLPNGRSFLIRDQGFEPITSPGKPTERGFDVSPAFVSCSVTCFLSIAYPSKSAFVVHYLLMRVISGIFSQKARVKIKAVFTCSLFDGK